MSKIYEIKYIGCDYTDLKECIGHTRMFCDGVEYIFNKKLKMAQEQLEEETKKGKEFQESKVILLPLEEKTEPSDKQFDEKIKTKILIHGLEKASKELATGSLKLNHFQKKNVKISFFKKNSDGEIKFGGIVGVLKLKLSSEELNQLLLKDYSNQENSNTVLQFQAVEEDMSEFHITIQIQSRFDANKDGMIGRPYFLSTMLLGRDMKLNDNNIPLELEELFDYLLLFWYRNLLARLILKGYYKTYQKFECNDNRLKGSIDVNRHIKLNARLNNGKVAYSLRENTIHNPLNLLIIMTYEYLKSKHRNFVELYFDYNRTLKVFTDYLKTICEYDGTLNRAIIHKNIKRISHPYFVEYEELREICLKIMRDEAITFFDGSTDNEINGILFYLPDLWEKYLYEEVIQKLVSKELLNMVTCEEQVKIKVLKRESSAEGLKDTYPDYVFFASNDSLNETGRSPKDKTQERTPFMILDAKFKKGWQNVINDKKDENYKKFSGLLEDYTKCVRDMNSIGGSSTGVIFPVTEEMNKIKFYSYPISQYNHTDRFYALPIFVPYTQEGDHYHYQDWENEFNQGMEECRKRLGIILQKELEFFKKTIRLRNQLKEERNKIKWND